MVTKGLKKFVQDVSWSLVSLVVSALVHLIVRIFLARQTGADNLGLYSLAFVAYSLGLVLSGFGIGTALTKYAAQYRDDHSKLSTFLSSGCIISLATGCLMGMILYLLSGLIATEFLHMPEMTRLLNIVALAFPFIALQKAMLGFMNGLRKMRLFAIINVVQNILVIALTVILILLGYGVVGAMLALVIPLILTSAFSLFSLREFISKPNVALYHNEITTIVIFALFVTLSNAISVVQGQVDTVMLGHYMTKTEVGYFSTALMVVQGIGMLSMAVQMITSPAIAAYWGSGNIHAIESMVNRIMKLTTVFMIPSALLVAFYASELSTSIFGGDFIAMSLPLQILLIGGVFGAIIGSVGGALSSTAFVKVLFEVVGLTLILNIVLNILLIPCWGVAGAAVANSATIVANTLLTLYLMQRLIKIRIDWVWFVKIMLFGAILGGITYATRFFISQYLSMPIILATFVIVVYAFFTSDSDRAIINSFIIRIIHRAS